MGCAESREETPAASSSRPFLDDYRGDQHDVYDDSQDGPFRPVPVSSTMGQPPQQQQHGIPLAGSSRLAQQHERLILELLPFKSADQFQEWLGSVFVRGAWQEFGRDFLNLNVYAREADKDKMAQKAKDAINSRNAKYLIFHPDKEGWTADDHHIRFMATVITDNLLKGLWSESEWKKKGLDIAKAIYEVLSFLRATKAPADPNPPQYEG